MLGRALRYSYFPLLLCERELEWRRSVIYGNDINIKLYYIFRSLLPLFLLNSQSLRSRYHLKAKEALEGNKVRGEMMDQEDH